MISMLMDEDEEVDLGKADSHTFMYMHPGREIAVDTRPNPWHSTCLLAKG